MHSLDPYDEDARGHIEEAGVSLEILPVRIEIVTNIYDYKPSVSFRVLPSADLLSQQN